MSGDIGSVPRKGIKRSDPEPRPVDGLLNRVAVEGQDPGKHYVWVSQVNNLSMNPGYYRSLGYQFSQYDPDEAQPVLGYEEMKQGDRMQSNGMILMECTLEHKAMLDAEGQKKADRIEDTIKRRDVLDSEEPMTAIERAKMRGIVTRRYGGDDREHWGF